MYRAIIAALVLAASFGVGCAFPGNTDKAPKFEGEDAKIAAVVDRLSATGIKRDGSTICKTLLAKPLADSIRAGKSDCAAELDLALADTDDFKLTVEKVQRSGDEATVQVRDGLDRARKLALVRTSDGWRLSNFGAG